MMHEPRLRTGEIGAEDKWRGTYPMICPGATSGWICGRHLRSGSQVGDRQAQGRADLRAGLSNAGSGAEEPQAEELHAIDREVEFRLWNSAFLPEDAFGEVSARPESHEPAILKLP